ncbi:hypothetical protein LINPERPRIM_LOCUS16948, partial [Linum perenne]
MSLEDPRSGQYLQGSWESGQGLVVALGSGLDLALGLVGWPGS